MEELQKIIDWIVEYDKEYECFPHPNLIKMRMKLRVEELQKKVNVTLGNVSNSCDYCERPVGEILNICEGCKSCSEH